MPEETSCSTLLDPRDALVGVDVAEEVAVDVAEDVADVVMQTPHNTGHFSVISAATPGSESLHKVSGRLSHSSGSSRSPHVPRVVTVDVMVDVMLDVAVLV